MQKKNLGYLTQEDMMDILVQLEKLLQNGSSSSSGTSTTDITQVANDVINNIDLYEFKEY